MSSRRIMRSAAAASDGSPKQEPQNSCDSGYTSDTWPPLMATTPPLVTSEVLRIVELTHENHRLRAQNEALEAQLVAEKARTQRYKASAERGKRLIVRSALIVTGADVMRKTMATRVQNEVKSIAELAQVSVNRALNEMREDQNAAADRCQRLAELQREDVDRTADQIVKNMGTIVCPVLECQKPYRSAVCLQNHINTKHPQLMTAPVDTPMAAAIASVVDVVDITADD